MWPFAKQKKQEPEEVTIARKVHDEATTVLEEAVKARDVLKELLDSKRKKEDEENDGR